MSFSANALEAGIEDAYVKIIVNSFDGGPPPDPNTLDGNADGVVDRAQYRLLDALLRDESAPHHAEVLAAYQANLARFVQDNTLGIRCVFMEALYHFTCDDFNKHTAGTFTLAEPNAVQTVISEFSDSAGVTLNPANYKLSLAGLLPGNADLDGDGYTNAQEFAAVCGNMDAYVAAVKDPALNPETLPCCANCVLHITAEPQDFQGYTGGPLTLSVTVRDWEGAVHYQWRKGENPVGTDAPVLVFNSLRVSDSGLYQCTVTDASETVTTRTAQLTVAEPMAIVRQPLAAKRHAGETHTFLVAVTGGLPPLHYQWIKDDNHVGGDSPELVLTEIVDGDAGSYWCVITDLRGQIVSEKAGFVVLAPGEGEDTGVVEGELGVEGETPVEGEVVHEGEVPVEGEIAVEGELHVEGEALPEGEGEGESGTKAGEGCFGCTDNNDADWFDTLPIVSGAGFVFFLLGWRSGTR